MKTRKTRRVFLKIVLSVFAVGFIFLLNPLRSSENSFINFTLSDVKNEDIKDFVVESGAASLALSDYGATVRKSIPEIGKTVLSFKNAEDAERFAASAASNQIASQIEKDVEVRAFVSFDDTKYASQTNLSQMALPTGWEYLNDASAVKIAIVDTGVRGTHEELNGKTLAGYNVLTSSAILADANSDDNGHGTAMASIAAAKANNAAGIVGVAYSASIIPVKTLNSAGNGLASDVATGIIWAVNSGAKVINLSLGGADYSQTMHDAIQYAINLDRIVIAAAGNDGGTLAYPGRDALTVSVGSVNSSNVRSSFSNYGPEIDVMAPGESIWHADYSADDSYSQDNGTSVSAAEVSGIAALSSVWHSGGSSTDLANYINASAQKLSGMSGANHTDYYGYGLIDYNRLQTIAGDYHFSFVSQSGYPTMDSGQSNNFILNVKNTGKSTWRQQSVNLGTSRSLDRIPVFTREGDGPSGWLSGNRVKLQETTVAPGSNGTFSFWMKNTGVSAGYYQEYFRPIVENVTWMEDYGIYWGVSVPSAADRYHCQFVSQNAYPTLDSGQSYNFQITLKNTGTTTWQRGIVNLATNRSRDRIPIFTREGDGPSGWLTGNRIAFQEASVAPGANATFSFWMKNTGVGPGVYQEYFQPVADGISWMEDYGVYWNVSVPSIAERYQHQFVSQNAYPTLARGQAYNFQLTVKNTGTATWQRGAVNLATNRPQDRISIFTREGDGPSGWIKDNRIYFQESSVAPGANATFSFWMRNDGVSSGFYPEYFRLVADGITWMQDYGIYWGITSP